MQYQCSAYLLSFRQHWLASSPILSGSDAHFHHSRNTVSNMHDLLVFMQFLMLEAMATRDIGNSWATGTQSLPAVLSALSYCYLLLSHQYASIYCLPIL